MILYIKVVFVEFCRIIFYRINSVKHVDYGAFYFVSSFVENWYILVIFIGFSSKRQTNDIFTLIQV